MTQENCNTECRTIRDHEKRITILEVEAVNVKDNMVQAINTLQDSQNSLEDKYERTHTALANALASIDKKLSDFMSAEDAVGKYKTHIMAVLLSVGLPIAGFLVYLIRFYIEHR